MPTEEQTNQEVAQAQQQGQQRQQQLDTQSTQLQGQYNQAQQQTQSAYQGLSDYTKSMVNPADYYNQQVTSTEQQMGINPADILKANQSLARTQEALYNAPQAAAQIGGGYGTTAGMVDAETANLQGKYGQQMVGQTGMVNAFQNSLTNALNQAGKAGDLFSQGQQTKVTALSNLYQNSTAQMQASGQTMTAIEDLAQKQGSVTADQITAYQNARSNYLQAQASQESAAAAMINAQAQKQMADIQTNQYNASSAYLNTQGNRLRGTGNNATFVNAQGQAVTPEEYARETNQSLQSVLGVLAGAGNTQAMAAQRLMGNDFLPNPSMINQGNNKAIYQYATGTPYVSSSTANYNPMTSTTNPFTGQPYPFFGGK